MIEPAYYHRKIAIFLAANQEQILGELASRHSFALDITQKNAWIEQISSLKQQLTGFPNHEIFLEFAIPRMGKRVDAYASWNRAQPAEALREDAMSENEETKKPLATEVIANLPRRDNYAPDKGSGNPHLQPGELHTSETRNSHKLAKQVQPKKA